MAVEPGRHSRHSRPDANQPKIQGVVSMIPQEQREHPQLRTAAIVGAVLGLLPLPVCWDLLGLGHGTVWPSYLFYGPAALAVFLAPHPLPANIDDLVLLVLWPALYAGYSMILAQARSKGYQAPALIMIVVVHYLGAAIGIAVGYDYLANFQDNLLRCPEAGVIGFVLFIGLHMLVISYVCGMIPRPFQYSLRTLFLVVTIAALCCSIAALFYAWPR